MKRLVLLAASYAALFSTADWIRGFPTADAEVKFSPDENVHKEQLPFQSEDLRLIRGEWRTVWFNDMPSHLTPVRVHGGIVP